MHEISAEQTVRGVATTGGRRRAGVYKVYERPLTSALEVRLRVCVCVRVFARREDLILASARVRGMSA